MSEPSRNKRGRKPGTTTSFEKVGQLEKQLKAAAEHLVGVERKMVAGQQRADETIRRIDKMRNNQVDIINRLLAAQKANEPWTHDDELHALQDQLARTQIQLEETQIALREANRLLDPTGRNML